MNSQPLVTVAVICYNSAEYVEETLNSILRQTYKNIELIISDDGSTDGTQRICEDWLSANRHIFTKTLFLRNASNMGVAAHANNVLKSVNGQWLKIISGDDSLKDDCIELNINFIKEKPSVNLLQSYSDVYNDEFKENKKIGVYPEAKAIKFFELDKSEDQYKAMLKKGNFISAPSMFLKSSVIIQDGGFDERFPFLEDFPLWLTLMRAGYKFHFMPVSTANYRVHQGSITKGHLPFMSTRNAQNNILFLTKFFSKEEKSLLVQKEIAKYKIIIYLNNKGLNNKSLISSLLYRVLLKL